MDQENSPEEMQVGPRQHKGPVVARGNSSAVGFFYLK